MYHAELLSPVFDFHVKCEPEPNFMQCIASFSFCGMEEIKDVAYNFTVWLY